MVEQIDVDFKNSPLSELLSGFHLFEKDELYFLREKNFHILKNSSPFNLCKENWKDTPFFDRTQRASFHFFPFQDQSLNQGQKKLEKLGSIKRALSEVFPDFHSSYRLVFINGVFNLELSNPFVSSKVKVFSISDLFSKNFSSLKKAFDFEKGEEEQLKKIKSLIIQKMGDDFDSFKEGFSFLNDALFLDGSVIYFEREAKIDLPVHLIFISEMDLMDQKKLDPSKKVHFFTQQPKNFIFFDSFSKASIIESYVSFSKSSTFTNSKTDLVLSKGSQVAHVRFQKEDIHSFHIGATEVLLEEQAHLKSLCLNLGAGLSHLRTDFNLNGKSSTVDSLGVYFPQFDQQHMNHSVFLHHRAPFSHGTQYSKGVLVKDSKVIFNGKVKIEKEGNKAYSNQLSKNLILSKKGDIQTNPQLEVHADDVSATHGATVGRLNEDEIFYLRSRGLTYTQALSILLEGFIQDVFLRLDEPLKRSVESFFKGVFKRALIR